jgi:hypothetical protein
MPAPAGLETRIAQHSIQTEQGNYELTVTGSINEDDSLTVNSEFSSNEGQLCRVTITAVATNPLELLGALAINAISAYGLCVGTRFLASSWSIIRSAYDESKLESDDLEKLDRISDTLERLPNKKGEFKKEAIGALRGCAGKLIPELLKPLFEARKPEFPT